MKSRIHTPRATNALVSGALALSPCFALALASGCSSHQVSDGKSGETHFLCSTDDDCTHHFGSDDYYCGPKQYCESKADGGTPHGDGGQTGSGGATGSGGKGAGGAAGAGATGGGDFASCKTPPSSTCNAADTCAALGCPNMQYDEHGCQRQQCNKDDDCAADERCAMNTCESTTMCSVQGGACVCEGDASCGEVLRCNPTTTTGPRGEWVSLDVKVIQSPCAGPTFDRCTKTWHVTPDGRVTYTDGAQGPDGGAPVEWTLDTAQMYEVAGAVRGSDLRLAMRDGIPCSRDFPKATDASLNFSLELSTQTMTSGEVGQCMGGDNVYALVYNVLSQAPAAGGSPTGSSSNASPPAQAAVTFSSIPAPGKACTRSNGQISLPSKDNASVIQELNCDLAMGCSVDDYVVVNGDRGSTVSCSVVQSGDNYNVQLSLVVDGSATNELSGTFSADGVVSKTGGTVSIQESNTVAGGGGSQQDCTVTITPTLGVVGRGKIWASFDCGAFRDPRDINDTGCDVSGLFLFENCAD